MHVPRNQTIKKLINTVCSPLCPASCLSRFLVVVTLHAPTAITPVVTPSYLRSHERCMPHPTLTRHPCTLSLQLTLVCHPTSPTCLTSLLISCFIVGSATTQQCVQCVVQCMQCVVQCVQCVVQCPLSIGPRALLSSFASLPLSTPFGPSPARLPSTSVPAQCLSGEARQGSAAVSGTLMPPPHIAPHTPPMSLQWHRGPDPQRQACVLYVPDALTASTLDAT